MTQPRPNQINHEFIRRGSTPSLILHLTDPAVSTGCPDLSQLYFKGLRILKKPERKHIIQSCSIGHADLHHWTEVLPSRGQPHIVSIMIISIILQIHQGKMNLLTLPEPNSSTLPVVGVGRSVSYKVHPYLGRVCVVGRWFQDVSCSTITGLGLLSNSPAFFGGRG